ncbi:MAG: hypothetical protein ABFD79_02825 [Phycisphaerales bacterium]
MNDLRGSARIKIRVMVKHHQSAKVLHHKYKLQQLHISLDVLSLEDDEISKQFYELPSPQIYSQDF